jgi:threonine dehydratase
MAIRASCTFIHPFADADVMAGNATIALEILEDLPNVKAILVPYGGGGLACGIAAGARAAWPGRPPRIFACEVDTASPLDVALRAGQPANASYVPSFVDGIGSSVATTRCAAVRSLLRARSSHSSAGRRRRWGCWSNVARRRGGAGAAAVPQRCRARKGPLSVSYPAGISILQTRCDPARRDACAE